MRWSLLFVLGILAGCASAKPRLYEPGLLTGVTSWVVDFMYETGEVATTDDAVGGESITRTVAGQTPRALQLRDDIHYLLLDEHHIEIVKLPSESTGHISIHPVNFGSGGFKSCEVSITAPVGTQVARIRIQNGSRNATFKDDEDFAEFCADKIADLFKEALPGRAHNKRLQPAGAE